MKMWFELPQEILVTVLTKLSLRNLLRAGVVCNSWRAAMMEIKALKIHAPLHQLPSLSLYGGELNNDIDIVIDLSDKTIYGLHLSYSQRNMWYLGSSHGWLIMVDWNSKGSFILNPFTKEHIQLPCRAKVRNLALQTEHDVEDLWSHGLIICGSKAALSSSPNSDCWIVVVQSHYSGDRLAFYRLGDEIWTVFEAALDTHLHLLDVACYKGHAYAISTTCELMVLELGLDPKPTKHDILPPSETEIGASLELGVGTGVTFVHMVYLVESSGDLLMVLQLCVYRCEGEWTSLHTQGFCVFKMDTSGQCWVKVESLGDRMVFLSGSSSKSILTVGLSGFEGNCICFMEYDKLSVFYLDDKTIKPFFTCDEHYFTLKLPFIWAEPCYS